MHARTLIGGLVIGFALAHLAPLAFADPPSRDERRELKALEAIARQLDEGVRAVEANTEAVKDQTRALKEHTRALSR